MAQRNTGNRQAGKNEQASETLEALFQAWVDVDPAARAEAHIRITGTGKVTVASPQQVVHRSENKRDAVGWFHAVLGIEKADGGKSIPSQPQPSAD